jgi:hypothetical protein
VGSSPKQGKAAMAYFSGNGVTIRGNLYARVRIAAKDVHAPAPLPLLSSSATLLKLLEQTFILQCLLHALKGGARLASIAEQYTESFRMRSTDSLH